MVGEQHGAVQHKSKLYALKEDAAWEDKGTGYALVVGLGQSRRLIFRDEAGDQILHDRPIFCADVYQLQGEDKRSIIVWADPESELDWAISFQDPAGALKTFAELGNGQESSATKAPSLLPVPELRNLSQLSRMLSFVPPNQRDNLATECLAPSFVEGLRQVFRTAEDIGREEDLTLIWRIAKGIFLLSNQKLTERYLRQDMYEDVFGMLEYDDGLPGHKRIAHRLVLKVQVRFQPVLTIADEEIASRIHLIYRLQYLKDIVLPRLLDDSTFSSMTQMIQANTSTILVHLQKSDQLMDQLFKQLGQKDIQSLFFLQEACRLAKMQAPSARQLLYEKMMQRGLFVALTPFLLSRLNSSSDLPSGFGARFEASEPYLLVVEILQLSTLHDPSLLRRFLICTPSLASSAALTSLASTNGSEVTSSETTEGTERELMQRGPELLAALIRLLHKEADEGVQSQIADILRSVMDLSQLEGKDREPFLDELYDTAGAMDQLTAPLRTLGANAAEGLSGMQDCTYATAFALQLACELLSFAILHHGHRAKTFVAKHGLADQVAWMFAAPHRFLQLAPVRLIRAMVNTKDDAYHRMLTKSGIFEALVRHLNESMQPPALGGNLFVSAVCELLESLRVQCVKHILEHICSRHGDQLKQLAPRCKAVQILLSQHKQNLEKEVTVAERRGHAALRRRCTMTAADMSSAIASIRGSRNASRKGRAIRSSSGSSISSNVKVTWNSPVSPSVSSGKKNDNDDYDEDEEAEPFVGSLVDQDIGATDSLGNSESELQAFSKTAAHENISALDIGGAAQSQCAGSHDEQNSENSSCSVSSSCVAVLKAASTDVLPAETTQAGSHADHQASRGVEVLPNFYSDAPPELILAQRSSQVDGELVVSDSGKACSARMLSQAAKRARTGIEGPTSVFA